MKDVNYKQEYLRDEYTELDVKDNARYQEIAILVDRVDFIEAIKDIRIELGIKAPIDIRIRNSLPFRDKKEWKSKYKTWAFFAKDMAGQRLEKRLKLLLIKVHRPMYLLHVAIQVALFKSVKDDSGIVQILNKRSTISGTTIGIFPTINTTNEDIIEAWEEVKKWFKDKTFNKKKNTKEEFKRDRAWHWRNIRGESYSDIALSLEDEDFQSDYKKLKTESRNGINRDSLIHLPEVKQAIGRYRKGLK